MGVSDAINALRSDAVAESTLTNVMSESAIQAAQDAQKQASMVKQARDGAQAQLRQFMASVDGQRQQIRGNMKSFADETVGIIFAMINAVVSGSATGLIGGAMQMVAAGLDAKIIADNVKQRDFYWKQAMTAGAYVCMDTPVMPHLQR